MVRKQKRELKRCERCGHIWLPRKTNYDVRICPRCKSARWDQAK